MNELECLKCNAGLKKDECATETVFYQCEQCGSHYRITEKGTLVERWLGSLSIVLYPMIFEKDPQQYSEKIAKSLFAASQPGNKSIFKQLTVEQIQKVIDAINEEINHPTQNVKEILDCIATEENLRKYLANVALKLEELILM